MPWQKRQLSYGMKLLVTFGTGLLLFISVVSGIVWLLMVPAMIIQGPGPRDTIGEMIVIGTLLTLLFGLSVAALIVLWPYVSAQTSFKTSYGVIPAMAVGHMFEIRYKRVGLGRALSGKGTLRFDPQGICISGYLTPSPWLQMGVVALLTLLPLIFLGFGLGFLPALVIAYFIGRKRVELTLSYYTLGGLVVKDCGITMTCLDVPHKVTAFVSASDGERLYRELLPRFPSALNGWQG